MSDFDVLVLGAGTAGTAAARAASRCGASTALVDPAELGGTCILRGCMPTKALLESAHAAHVARSSEALGVRARVELDVERIFDRKDELVRRFQAAKIRAVESEDHELLRARGRLLGGGAVDVGGRRITAGRIVIATGSEPLIPAIGGLDQVDFLTSDDALELREPPASLLVVGGGAIGLELGQFFARLGTAVTLVTQGPLLGELDPEAGEVLASALVAEGLTILDRTDVRAARCEGGEVVLRCDRDGASRELRAARLLLATGRRPVLDGLGLEAAGVEVRDGAVVHDEAQRTTNPDVFVAGDATGRDLVLHVASEEGSVAGWNAAGGSPERSVDRRLALRVVFTDPPVAVVGLTSPQRAEAQAAGRRFVAGRAAFPETGRALTMGVTHGTWVIWSDAESCELVGSSIVGPRADDLVHLVMLMMHARLCAQDLADLPWYHPTLAEVMINVSRDLASRLDCKAPPPPPA